MKYFFTEGGKMKKFMVFIWAILLFGLVSNAAIEAKKGEDRFILARNTPVLTNAATRASATSTAGVSWIISTIDRTGNVGKHTSIAVDANEKVHISYFDFTNGKLKYTTNATGSWITSIVDSASDYDTGIALDANGKVHIVYDGTGGDLKYATNKTGSWVISTIESGAYSGVLGDDSIAIDSYGKVHISYFKASDLDLKYATNASGTWSTSIVVNGGAAYSASIGVDSNNKIHISYYDDASPDSIKYVTNISGSLVVTTISTIGFAAGWKTSLAVDSNNKVHISYYEWTNDELKYASNASGTWQTESVDKSSGGVWDASLAIDKVNGNQVHMVYHSYAGFKYARKSAGTWQISIIDESWTGSYNSIAIGSSSIHVSYHDGYDLDLKYASLSSVAAPRITVTLPNGGESWIVGSSHNITWNSTGTIANVNIDYSINNGSSWTSVAAGTTNDGSYTWTVPSTHSTTCLVRVSDAANATTMDTSNAVFNILDNGTPAITVTSPNGGESWQAGTTKDITWNSSGPISAVKIELSFNGGSLWSTIIASTPNDGSYSWDIVKVPSLNCFMRISDVLGTSSDTSDAPFVLQSPPSLTNNYFVLPKKWTDTPFGSGGWYVGDFNGDGRSDLLRYLLDGTRNEVLLSTGSAFAAGTNWLTADHGADGWHVGDYNGDGKDDILRYVPGVSGAQVFLSNGSNFIYSGSWSGAGNGSDGWYIGDFNGDGRDDIMRYVPGVSGADVFLSDGTKFNYSGNWSGAGNGADGWYIGDFNGDGRSDLMRYYPGVSGGEVFLSDGTKFTYSGSWTGAGNGDNGWYLGKFRGTARTDIMRYVLLLSGADVFLNGDGVYHYDGSWTPAGRGDNDWHVGDFNGDGRDDLMRSIVGVTGADVLLSAVTSGAAMSPAQSPTPAGERNVRWLNDVPASKPLSAEELAFVERIKNRIVSGELISIYQIQKEYETLTGRPCRRVRIMKLFKQNKLDKIFHIQPESQQG